MNPSSSQEKIQPSSPSTFLRLFWTYPGVILGLGRLPAILGICCLVSEILVGIGFLAAIVLIPYSQARVADGRESIRIIVPHNTFDVGCNVLFGDGSRSKDIRDQPWSNVSYQGLGSLSVEPLSLRADEVARNDTPNEVLIQAIEDVVTIVQPANAARALEFVRWPFIFCLLCTGLTGVAILDLFRRMLGSIAKKEVFTAANIRNVNRLGILFIASSIAKMLLAGWLVHRFIAFVALSQPLGKSVLESSFEGNGSGVGIGLMILVLAGVFRQGLALKEDSQLTI